MKNKKKHLTEFMIPKRVEDHLTRYLTKNILANDDYVFPARYQKLRFPDKWQNIYGVTHNYTFSRKSCFTLMQ